MLGGGSYSPTGRGGGVGRGGYDDYNDDNGKDKGNGKLPLAMVVGVELPNNAHLLYVLVSR